MSRTPIRSTGLLLALAFGGGLLTPPAVGGDALSWGVSWGDERKARPKNKQAAEYALLYGSVFDATGRTVRGAQVRVRQKEGKKKWEASSDARGEFAIQLPPGAIVYIAEVSLPGFDGETKEVAFTADERQDISLKVTRKQ